MTDDAAFIRLVRSRVAFELNTRLYMPVAESEDIVACGGFDGLGIQESLRRLKLLRDVLTPRTAGEMLRRRPVAITLPLERLHPLLKALMSQGMPRHRAQQLIAVQSDLISTTYTSAESLLASIDMSAVMTQQDELPLTRRLTPSQRTIYIRFRDARVEELFAATCAKRLEEYFPTTAHEIMDLFAASGWRVNELMQLVLTERNRAWVSNPHALFAAEEDLTTAFGISKSVVREILTARHEFLTSDRSTIGEVCAALQDAGMTKNDIVVLAFRKPKVLMVAPALINNWILHLNAENIERGPSILARMIRQKIVATTDEDGETTEFMPYGTSSVIEEDQAIEIPPTHDWHKLARRILKYGSASWTAQDWQTFEATPENAMLWDRTRSAPYALDHFVRWTGINLPPDSSTREVRFFAKMLLLAELRPVLALSVPVLQHRLCALRSIVQLEFMQTPTLLLIPFERVPPHELRFRVHETAARGKEPERPPHLLNLLAPTRDEFLKKLNATCRERSRYT